MERKNVKIFINNIEIKALISAFFAFLGCCFELEINSQSENIKGNVLLLIVIYIWYVLYKKIYTDPDKKRYLYFTMIFSFFCSTFIVIGDNLREFDINKTFIGCTKILLLTFYVFPIITNITKWIERSKKTKEKKMLGKKQILCCFSIVLISWFLGWLALFPGVYGIDAPTWYKMWSQSDVPISSQWSPLISGLFYFFVSLGIKYCKSAEVGFGIYSFLQMMFVLYVVWNMLLFLNSNIGEILVYIAVAFFSCVPTHMILSVTSAQDSIFAACFAMGSMELLKMAWEANCYWNYKKNIIRFIFWMCLMCIVRNNGIYIIWIMSIMAFFFLKNYRNYFFKTIFAITMIVLFYQGPIYNYFHIQKGTAVREMLSIPLQQMAAAYNFDTTLPESIKIEIEQYIKREDIKNYYPEISDPIKNYFRIDKLKKDPLNFLNIYLMVGRESPKSYLIGALMQTYGLWYLNKQYPDKYMWHPYINFSCIDSRQNWGNDALYIERHSFFGKYEYLLRKLFGYGSDVSGYGGELQNDFVKIPLLSAMCRMGTYFWIIIYMMMYGFYKKWKDQYLVILFAFGLTVTIFLSPLMYYRYYAPIIFSMPVILSPLFKGRKENVIS